MLTDEDKREKPKTNKHVRRSKRRNTRNKIHNYYRPGDIDKEMLLEEHYDLYEDD